MQVSILTVDRSPNPNYLRQTFERLRLARRRYRTWFNAEIVLGNQGTSHLPETIPPWTKLITPTEAEQQIIDDLDFPTKHHAYNYNRILKSSEENLLLLEDDALLSHDFFFDLKKMVSYAHSIGSSFIINLFDSRVHEEGQPRLEVEPAGGFGTVAMYFSGQARKAVRDQSYHRYVNHRQVNRGIDIHLRRECHSQLIPVYRMSKKIVSHIGTVTTGCQGIPNQVE